MKSANELILEFEKLLEEANVAGCVEEFTTLLFKKIITINEIITANDPIWYVDFETGEVEKGIICSATYANGKLDCFSVDFVETDDFDEFVGDTLGKSFFRSKDAAKAALILRQSDTN